MGDGTVVKVLPDDEYNRVLVSNVHPADWTNPEPRGRYDLAVIGAGTAGLVTAAGAAGLGARVALVERHLLGGDCLNVGCVPSKAVIRASRSARETRLAGAFGVRGGNDVQVDFAAVMERMRRLRSGISSHDSVKRFQGLGVDVFLGEARFTGEDTIEAEGKTIRFMRAAIATGARAAAPAIEGLSETGYLTNETVFSLTEIPKRLLVIGGGPIGCELAQAFHRLGSEVTILQRPRQLLGREDADAAEILHQVFLREGIRLLLGAVPKIAASTADGKLIRYERDGRVETILADEILIGVGRAPNVEGLGLEAAGVKYDLQNGVLVDDFLRTSNPRIYAAGDICLRYKFTHMADAAARIVIQNALFSGRRRVSGLTVPWVTYTDPEIAHAGMYERDAKEKGIEIETFVKPLREVDRAVLDGEEEGFVKILVKKGTDRILGATIVARHAGEMLSEVTLAMAAGLGLKSIANTIHPYPTQAEAIRQAADLYNRSRLTLFAKRVLAAWLVVERLEIGRKLRRYCSRARNGFRKAVSLFHR